MCAHTHLNTLLRSLQVGVVQVVFLVLVGVYRIIFVLSQIRSYITHLTQFRSSMDSSAHPNTKIFAYIFGSFWADGHPNKLGVPKHHAFGSSQFRSYFVLSQIRPYIVARPLYAIRGFCGFKRTHSCPYCVRHPSQVVEATHRPALKSRSISGLESLT